MKTKSQSIDSTIFSKRTYGFPTIFKTMHQIVVTVSFSFQINYKIINYYICLLMRHRIRSGYLYIILILDGFVVLCFMDVCVYIDYWMIQAAWFGHSTEVMQFMLALEIFLYFDLVLFQSNKLLYSPYGCVTVHSYFAPPNSAFYAILKSIITEICIQCNYLRAGLLLLWC